MKIKGVIDEDFVNYKLPCMMVMCHSCSFKCDKECGQPVCQNSVLATTPDIKIEINELINRYLNNPITHAIVFGGLEPLDDFYDVLKFISILRYDYLNDDPVVIYTGYTEKEINENETFAMYFDGLRTCKNIIVKFGRFIPNQKPHYDEVLGVKLASDNQYAVRYENAN